MCLAAALWCGDMVLPETAAEKRSMGTWSISLDGDTGVVEPANPGGGIFTIKVTRPPRLTRRRWWPVSLWLCDN
jgi:hypothetical protein